MKSEMQAWNKIVGAIKILVQLVFALAIVTDSLSIQTGIGTLFLKFWSFWHWCSRLIFASVPAIIADFVKGL
jgi:hypothetical protein